MISNSPYNGKPRRMMMFLRQTGEKFFLWRINPLRRQHQSPSILSQSLDRRRSLPLSTRFFSAQSLTRNSTLSLCLCVLSLSSLPPFLRSSFPLSKTLFPSFFAPFLSLTSPSFSSGFPPPSGTPPRIRRRSSKPLYIACKACKKSCKITLLLMMTLEKV